MHARRHAWAQTGTHEREHADRHGCTDGRTYRTDGHTRHTNAGNRTQAYTGLHAGTHAREHAGRHGRTDGRTDGRTNAARRHAQMAPPPPNPLPPFRGGRHAATSTHRASGVTVSRTRTLAQNALTRNAGCESMPGRTGGRQRSVGDHAASFGCRCGNAQRAQQAKLGDLGSRFHAQKSRSESRSDGAPPLKTAPLAGRRGQVLALLRRNSARRP